MKVRQHKAFRRGCVYVAPPTTGVCSEAADDTTVSSS